MQISTWPPRAGIYDRPPRLHAVARMLRAAAPHVWCLEDEVAALRQFVAPGAVCLDVGAEYGLYTWSLADLVGPLGRVYAVEPQPQLAALLRAGRRALGADNVTVHEIALDRSRGLGLLARPRRGPLGVPGRAFLAHSATDFGSNQEFRRHRPLVVPVTTLDAFVADQGLSRLDFVKADIEGAEARLLAGAERTLLTLRPVLLLELEDRHLGRYTTTGGEVTRTLAAAGYSAYRFSGTTWEPGRSAGRNVLFLPPRSRLLHRPRLHPLGR